MIKINNLTEQQEVIVKLAALGNVVSDESLTMDNYNSLMEEKKEIPEDITPWVVYEFFDLKELEDKEKNMVKKIFKVTIIEKLVKNIAVEAESLEEATQKVDNHYLAEEIILSAENYDGGYEITGEEITEEEAKKIKSLEDSLEY